MYKFVMDQIKTWFWLKDKIPPVLVSRARWEAKRKICSSKKTCATITGPIGATIGTLRHIGWNPVTPFKWVDGSWDL